MYFISRANNGYSGELELAKFALKIIADAQGWTYDEATGVLYEIGGNVVEALRPAVRSRRRPDQHALHYYNLTLDRPEHEWGTTERRGGAIIPKCGIPVITYAVGKRPHQAMCGVERLLNHVRQLVQIGEPSTATNSVAG